MTENKPVRFALNIDADLLASVTAKAEIDCRTPTSLINVILSAWNDGRFYQGNFPLPVPVRSARVEPEKPRYSRPVGRSPRPTDVKELAIGIFQGIKKYCLKTDTTVNFDDEHAIITMDQIRTGYLANGFEHHFLHAGWEMSIRRAFAYHKWHERIDNHSENDAIEFHRKAPD